MRRLTRQGLGADARHRLLEKGRRLERPAAVAYGLSPQAPTEAGPARRRTPATLLSNREREVAELVAGGLSDREIAIRLVISRRTAESHVQHILTKLGFRSRSQIAAWVAATASFNATPAR